MYDVVIVSHEKDFNKIKFVVEHADRHLKNFESFYLILMDKPFNDLDLIKNKTNKPIHLYKENDVIQLDFKRVNYRPTWIYQILLKMFQNVTKNDNFLILESDGVINRDLNFFEDNKTIFYLGRDQPLHPPCFIYNDLLNIKKMYHHSFISEVMMYDKKYIKKLFEHCGCEDSNDFIEKYIYRNMTDNCYPADYELYGNFMYNFYPNEMIFKNYNYSLNGSHSLINDIEIKRIIERNKHCDYISFHTWI